MIRLRTRIAVLFIAGFLLAAGLLLLRASNADSRPRVPPDVFRAVRAEWRAPAARVKAFDVVACETGGTYDTDARNGQYLGLFQMGATERARYGHGPTARAQARAAHRLYRDRGWSPWGCA